MDDKQKILNQLDGIIEEEASGAANVLKALQMKIDLLSLMPKKTAEKEDAGESPADTGPAYAFDPKMAAAMADPKLRARMLNLQTAIARKAEK